MYTIKDIQKLGPCKEYTEERLKELWAGRESLSRREILKLDIDIDDKNWVVPQLVSTEVGVTWAQYCADAAKKHAANAVVSAASSNAAHYAANARFAANARAAATNARCVTRYAAANAGSAALSAWSGNKETELYRLLTVLCDMEEKRNESK